MTNTLRRVTLAVAQELEVQVEPWEKLNTAQIGEIARRNAREGALKRAEPAWPDASDTTGLLRSVERGVSAWGSEAPWIRAAVQSWETPGDATLASHDVPEGPSPSIERTAISGMARLLQGKDWDWKEPWGDEDDQKKTEEVEKERNEGKSELGRLVDATMPNGEEEEEEEEEEEDEETSEEEDEEGLAQAMYQHADMELGSTVTLCANKEEAAREIFPSIKARYEEEAAVMHQEAIKAASGSKDGDAADRLSKVKERLDQGKALLKSFQKEKAIQGVRIDRVKAELRQKQGVVLTMERDVGERRSGWGQATLDVEGELASMQILTEGMRLSTMRELVQHGLCAWVEETKNWAFARWNANVELVRAWVQEEQQGGSSIDIKNIAVGSVGVDNFLDDLSSLEAIMEGKPKRRFRVDVSG